MTMTVQDYLARRRRYEVGLWALFLLVQWVAQCQVKLIDNARSGQGFGNWELLVWEGSSLLVLGALLPLMLYWDHRFPLRIGQLQRNLAIHALLTLPWSLLHVAGMVTLRAGVYRLLGQVYDFGDWPRAFLYEYMKDFRTYGSFLVLIYVYRFFLLRLQGEASLLGRPDRGEPVEPVERPERLLVKKFGKEFLVNVRDIEWAEAAGNYVNLHVGGRVYPLRDTMTNFQRRLDPDRFARVHRSYIVNLDSVVEIEPLDSGDARIHIRGGNAVPLSRRYREQLRSGLA
ncbi:LytTR family DNA-binding domain-containing protein [Microbulbifer sp. SAOS-129_SWC]|uniref:LytR/AlgR family response regulator transcription factor n=1 Tax=Microbulbifer sp. SAOS-129_SWC TaxID=3145235 RepID=UPI0032164882